MAFCQKTNDPSPRPCARPGPAPRTAGRRYSRRPRRRGFSPADLPQGALDADHVVAFHIVEQRQGDDATGQQLGHGKADIGIEIDRELVAGRGVVAARHDAPGAELVEHHLARLAEAVLDEDGKVGPYRTGVAGGLGHRYAGNVHEVVVHPGRDTLAALDGFRPRLELLEPDDGADLGHLAVDADERAVPVLVLSEITDLACPLDDVGITRG